VGDKGKNDRKGSNTDLVAHDGSSNEQELGRR
jgi:hypothetical protein